MSRSPILLKALTLLTTLARLSPYLLGVVFIWFPIRKVYFDPFLERALYFVALFAVWQLFLFIAFRWFLPQTHKNANLNEGSAARAAPGKLLVIGRYAALITSAVASLLLLQFFKERLPVEHFYLALFALGTVALRRSLAERKSLAGSLMALFCACCAVGYLSFLIVDPFWKWEPLLPCAGVAALFVAQALSTELAEKAVEGSPMALRPYRIYARLVVLLFILAPTLVASLYYWGKLSHNFVFVFGIFPLLLPLAEALRAGESTGIAPNGLGTRSKVIFLAYIAILFFVGLMGRFS